MTIRNIKLDTLLEWHKINNDLIDMITVTDIEHEMDEEIKWLGEKYFLPTFRKNKAVVEKELNRRKVIFDREARP